VFYPQLTGVQIDGKRGYQMTNFAIAGREPARNLMILEENIIGASDAEN
jgi:hypothetical protein